MLMEDKRIGSSFCTFHNIIISDNYYICVCLSPLVSLCFCLCACECEYYGTSLFTLIVLKERFCFLPLLRLLREDGWCSGMYVVDRNLTIVDVMKRWKRSEREMIINLSLKEYYYGARLFLQSLVYFIISKSKIIMRKLIIIYPVIEYLIYTRSYCFTFVDSLIILKFNVCSLPRIIFSIRAPLKISGKLLCWIIT